MTDLHLNNQLRTLEQIQPRRIVGSVDAVRGLSILVRDLPLPVGALVSVRHNGRGRATQPIARGEVVGFDGSKSVVMLFGPGDGISPGMPVVGEQSAQTAQVGESLLGRIMNGLGQPIDGGAPLRDTVARPINPPPTSAMSRRCIDQALPTGVRVIDAMATLGKGQRVGVFAGPGVGKSTLLASIARNCEADVSVIAMVGERGREVREFVEQTLGPDGLARSVVIVATGDESPLLRVRAALLAATVSEYFCDLGRDVMLMMDSITRLAQAQRQIGLNVGEQPSTKGYTPSVFAILPTLLERAGAMECGGSVTGIYSVLVEGDDLTEPVSDAARGILDGHIALSRKLAGQGFFPAVDPMESISRVADAVCDEHHISARRTLLRLMSAYAEAEELIRIGAYAQGSNPDCDVAIALKSSIDEFLRQDARQSASYPHTCRALIELAAAAEQHEAGRRPPATANGQAGHAASGAGR